MDLQDTSNKKADNKERSLILLFHRIFLLFLFFSGY